MMQKTQNVADMQRKFVVNLSSDVAKVVDEQVRGALVDAYLKLFACFSTLNWIDKNALGRAWFLALGQCGAYLETKNKKNPAAKYLGAVYRSHKKYWSQVIMIHKNRDAVIDVPKENIPKMRAKTERALKNIMAEIDLILARYNQYEEVLIATQTGRATPVGQVIPVQQAVPVQQALPVQQAVPVQQQNILPEKALAVRANTEHPVRIADSKPVQLQRKMSQNAQKIQAQQVVLPKIPQSISKSVPVSEPVKQQAPIVPLVPEKKLAPIVPLTSERRTEAPQLSAGKAVQLNAASMQLKVQMARRMQMWTIYNNMQRSA